MSQTIIYITYRLIYHLQFSQKKLYFLLNRKEERRTYTLNFFFLLLIKREGRRIHATLKSTNFLIRVIYNTLMVNNVTHLPISIYTSCAKKKKKSSQVLMDEGND